MQAGNVEDAKRAIEARIWSAVLVQTKGFGILAVHHDKFGDGASNSRELNLNAYSSPRLPCLRLSLNMGYLNRKAQLRNLGECTLAWHVVQRVTRFCSESLPDWLRNSL